MICNAAVQARIQGGGRGPCPPPPFSGGETRGPKTTHTEKKISKSDDHEARKKSCEVGGGLRGHKGKYFVHKSNKE